MRFFFDRTLPPFLSKAVIEILQGAGKAGDHSRRRYNPDPGDDVWMRELGNEGGWVVVTGDQRIFKNPAERKIWQEAGLTTFFLQGAWMHTPFLDQTWRLMRWLPRFIDIAEEIDAGTGLSVPLRWHGGKLKQLYRPRTS